MTWSQTVPGGLAMLALLAVPGWAALRLLGVRGAAAAAGGPAVTFGIVGALGILYALLGVRWALPAYLLGALGAVAFAALAGRLVRGTWRLEAVIERPFLLRGYGVPALLFLLGAGTLALAMTEGMGSPGQPAQTWDGVFHVNAAWTIRDTGNASMLGGLAPMFGGEEGKYYPTVWHAIVAVTPLFPRVAEAANVSSILLGAVIWPAGLVALARATFPGDRLPATVAPVLAATFVAFPVTVLGVLGTWPFAMTVAALPGALALLVETLWTEPGRRTRLPYALGTLAAALGLGAAHGSALFSLAAIGLAPLVVAIGRRLARLRDEGHPRAALAIAVALPALALAALVVAVGNPVMREVLTYPRVGQETYWPGLAKLLTDHPMVYDFAALSTNELGVGLAVLGAVVVLARRRARWLVGALVLTVGLTLLASGPETNPLRFLAGPWFTQAARLHALVVVPAVLLGAYALAWLARAIGALVARVLDAEDVWRGAALAALVCAVVAGTGTLRWPTHTQVMASTYTTWPIAYGTMLEEDEIALVDRAGEVLPAGSVVLGDPANGSAFLLNRAGVDVVFPQLSEMPASPARQILAERFELWRDDPAICEAVRELGVTHVYADTQTGEEGRKRSISAPGVRHMRPRGDDFAFVDEEGRASLWRFTGCD